ncbi:MAG: fasciclin domain-containing protein [Cyanobacteriota bacterium]
MTLSVAVASATTLAVAPVVQAGTYGAETKTAETADAATGTIVDVAVEAGSFTTLTQALEAAGLVDVLSGEGPFTVFAPTDEAFAALPEGTLEELLLPENREKLTQILTYHVIPGKALSTDLEAGEVVTVEGSPVEISLADGVMVNDANVVTADIEASNGVIHGIDKVSCRRRSELEWLLRVLGSTGFSLF